MSAAALRSPGASRQPVMTDAEFENALLIDMERFYDDPLGFVYYAFNWGHGELSESDGPDVWQQAFLRDIGDKLRADPDANIREATASGHGIGKTTITAWLCIWAMST